ncbi:MAG: hypothetical protein HGA94_04635, partial [Candidatus Aminicenantes bacterium]|nr:hypothetical protein [Candidatus Aminicenantes bacterium]
KYDDNFALAGYDRTHVAQLGFLYELPFLKDDKSALGKILGGWQLNGIVSMSSGSAFTPTLGEAVVSTVSITKK